MYEQGCPVCGQLMFLLEPPARLAFSNSTGTRVSCAAHGSPPPTITWLSEDGVPVTDVPGLREVLENGTLVVSAFSAAQYRGDVHAALYRCRAAGPLGTVLSRDMRLQAVMDVSWEVRVQTTPGAAGGAALLTCAPTPAVRAHVLHTTWYKDGLTLAPMASDTGRYVVGGGRGDVLVVRDARPDDTSAYACEAQHALTGDKRRSPPAMLAVSHSTGSMAPRMLTISEDETVSQGGDIRLVCCAIGSPPPTYSWFRHANGRLSPVSNSVRVSVAQQVLVIRRAQPADAGVWTCRAHNQFGEQRRDATLRVRSRLVVTVHPQLQVANSGSSVVFNCSVEGGGEARVRWLHDGVPVGGAERTLRVHGVARAHRGMYQCFAERDLDSAQAAAELRLGDTAPELHYTFIEQALHPGPALALHCAASGAPPPRFTWLLDGQPIEELNTPQRSISQFMRANGDVVSYLNITSVRAADGGRYTCRAHNSRGAAEHSTRLNVYGPPSIRSIGPLRVVAGLNATVYCPYSGFPISEIRWQRGAAGGERAAGAGGSLRLWPAEPADAGLYSCRVTAPSGHYAQKDVQIFVRNPPKIAGFSFPSDLVEGSSVQVLCGITSGDKPVYFSWLKDGQHIPSNLQVQEKSLDEFSFLIFSHVTSQHSGEYTCVASNTAAEVNHTARLAVKVAPSWVFEPQDASVLLGTQVIVHCSTKGYPEPQIAWLKEQGGEFRALPQLEPAPLVLRNGSLSAPAAARVHEGRYMCRADNGVGRGLSKVITISVNEPAHFEFSSRNMSVRRTAGAALACAARGDPPIQLHWTHNTQRLDLSTYRVSVSEKRSESGASSTLSIAHAERRDSGVYRCRAENAYGRDELLIYLAVQEFPEAPRGLRVVGRTARAARLAWRRGYDGNARLRAHRLQYRVVGATQHATPLGIQLGSQLGTQLSAPRQQQADWTDAPTREISPDLVHQR
ncbi:PREDICTED: Down syndrome cell adhesion molecule-like protein Dscam2 [Papilio polytes]|uniref:Down syndrome cell adhesion molecule-like protein Dscam2 n=1 Tax=Papilio polytes TaxID=76194 RepID=UPI00067656BE|nr:PREDICTED: Down syndrome cell adhesion molecule-like protein Dscam2 [Papilio polytes]